MIRARDFVFIFASTFSFSSSLLIFQLSSPAAIFYFASVSYSIAILFLFASNNICTVDQSSSFFASILDSDWNADTFPSSMASSSIFMHLFFFIAFILSVRAQSILPSTIATSSTTASESASASSSSQMIWWEKSWDVVVVGSGPAGIIGNIPSFISSSFLLLFSPIEIRSSMLLFNFTFTNNFVKLLPNVLLILQTYPFSYSNLEVHHTPMLEALLIRIGWAEQTSLALIVLVSIIRYITIRNLPRNIFSVMELSMPLEAVVLEAPLP
jgi:hypothetical protein